MENNELSKKILKGTGIYAIGTFGSKILTFLIVPLYTYYLETSELGSFDVMLSALNLLIPIITIQVSDAAYRWLIKDETNNSRYIRTTYQIIFINSILAFGVIIVLSVFTKIDNLFYFSGMLVSSVLFQTTQKILRGLKNQILFVTTGLVYTLVYLGMNVFLLCFLRRGMEGLCISYIIANSTALVGAILKEKRIRIKIVGEFDKSVSREFVKYAIPLIPNYLSWWIMDSSDRFIVLWCLGNSSNGILAVAYKFPLALQSVLGLFINSWQDVSVAEYDNPKYNTKLFERLYIFSFSLLWFLVPLTKLVSFYIFSADYKSACNIIGFYYLGVVLQIFSSFYGVGYLRNKSTKGAFATSVYGAIINALINIVFINLIGVYAAAISTFLGYLIMWIIRERQNRVELGIKLKYVHFWFLLIITVIMCILSIIVANIYNLALAIIGMSLFLIVNKKEIKTFIVKIKNIRNFKK